MFFACDKSLRGLLYFFRRSDEKTAQAAIRDLYADGVQERKDLSRKFWQRVGQLKARGRISLADCFCIALAQDEFDTLNWALPSFW